MGLLPSALPNLADSCGQSSTWGRSPLNGVRFVGDVSESSEPLLAKIKEVIDATRPEVLKQSRKRDDGTVIDNGFLLRFPDRELSVRVNQIEARANSPESSHQVGDVSDASRKLQLDDYIFGLFDELDELTKEFVQHVHQLEQRIVELEQLQVPLISSPGFSFVRYVADPEYDNTYETAHRDPNERGLTIVNRPELATRFPTERTGEGGLFSKDDILRGEHAQRGEAALLRNSEAFHAAPLVFGRPLERVGAFFVLD